MDKKRQTTFEQAKQGGERSSGPRERSVAPPRVKHRTRAQLDGRTPVHITVRMLPEIARLRRRGQYRVLRRVFARTARKVDFRICHYSVQSDHIHLICEPRTAEAMARGMTAFSTSCARRLNALVGRHGRVFADRYHARYLRSPAQVRRALSRVLNNWRHHREDLRSYRAIDPFASGDVFDGWTWQVTVRLDGDGRAPVERLPWLAPDDPPPVPGPRFWLLAVGWRRHGAIDPWEEPGCGR